MEFRFSNGIFYGISKKLMKRQIFYISGFDPRGSRFYYNLHKQQLSSWQHLYDAKAIISKKKQVADHVSQWQVTADQDVNIEYNFLHWDDIIKDNWLRKPQLLLCQAIKAYYGFLRNSQWKFLRSLPHNGPITAFFQPVYALALLIIATILSIIIIVFAGQNMQSIWPIILASLIQLVSLCYVAKMRPLWLLRLYIFHYHIFKNHYSLIDDRLENWRDYISKHLDVNADEVWLVGHSNGTLIAPLLLEKIIAENQSIAKIKLITLGNLSPLNTAVSVMKRPQQALKKLIKHKFFWLDISSPADGACFALVDPLVPLATKVDVLLKSPRFHKSYDIKRYNKIKRDEFKLHFEYLRCGDKINPSSYLQMMMSKQPLQKNI
jgi:hypothetical protein